jgi:hypothetical protein
VTPCRFLDTRDPALTPWYSTLGPWRYGHVFLLQESCGIPYGARGALLTMTATQATHAGHVSIWPRRATHGDDTSFLNFAPGRDVSTFTIVPLAPVPTTRDISDICFSLRFSSAPGDQPTVHVIIDVIGYLR